MEEVLCSYVSLYEVDGLLSQSTDSFCHGITIVLTAGFSGALSSDSLALDRKI